MIEHGGAVLKGACLLVSPSFKMYHSFVFFFENSNLPRGKPTFEYPYGKSLTKTNWYHYNTRELEMSLLVVSFVRDLFEK